MTPGTTYFERNAGGGQLFGFLAAPAENKGVAALEAHHRQPGPGSVHQQLVDAALGNRMVPGALSHIEDFSPRRDLFQELRVGQLVINHDVGPAQERQAFHRNQPRVAGPGAYQVNHTVILP